MPIEQLPVADSLQPTGVRQTPPPPRVAHRATLPSYNIIYFYHPGCNKPFFFVQAYDQDPVLRKWGVHHCIVLDALSILAGNQPGFVSTDLQGLHKVNLESTPILTEQKYYFHVDLPSHLSSSSYRVMESFRAWRPPDGLPHHWADNGVDPDIRGQGYAESQMSSTVKTQDKNCIISGYSEAIQNAHLVPAAEKAWFQHHNQTIHNNNPHVISPDDISNGISLRDDIHRLLDDQKFVFTPLEGYIVVFFIEWFPNYASRFHRTAVELPDRISPHHVFSRFAYNIIESSAPLVKGLPNDYIQQVPQELRKPKSSSRAKRRPSEEGASTLEAVSEAPKAVSETRDEPMDGLAEDVEGLSAPSVVSSDEDDEVDSEAHSRKVKMWEKAYPKLQVEVEDSDDRNFNYLGWHPELPKMDKLVEDWFKKNPHVRQLSDGSTASHV